MNPQAPDEPPLQGLAIHLLGPPRVERGGAPVPLPRGHKVWGLLAYLVRNPKARGRLRRLKQRRLAAASQHTQGEATPASAARIL